DRARARGLLAGRRQPRLRPGGGADRLRPHPPAARRRARLPRGDPVLEQRLLDLRAGPLLAPGLRPLLPLRLAGDGDRDRRRRAAAVPVGAARRPQPAVRRAGPAEGARMIQPELVTAGVRIVRAEESWIPVLFGGMIPIVAAGAVFWLIWHAVRDNPENDEPEDKKGEPDESDQPPR